MGGVAATILNGSNARVTDATAAKSIVDNTSGAIANSTLLQNISQIISDSFSSSSVTTPEA